MFAPPRRTNVLAVDADLMRRLGRRGDLDATGNTFGPVVARPQLDHARSRVASALTGSALLGVVEGAAGAGNTTTLATVADLLEMENRRLIMVTPTPKAAQAAADQIGADTFSAARLVHQHGFRWDEDGALNRVEATHYSRAQLRPYHLMFVTEAGMLDQDIARAPLTIADASGGPSTGPHVWAHPDALLDLDALHRLVDEEYAAWAC